MGKKKRAKADFFSFCIKAASKSLKNLADATNKKIALALDLYSKHDISVPFFLYAIITPSFLAACKLFNAEWLFWASLSFFGSCLAFLVTIYLVYVLQMHYALQKLEAQQIVAELSDLQAPEEKIKPIKGFSVLQKKSKASKKKHLAEQEGMPEKIGF